MKVIDKDAVLSIIDNAMAEEMKLFETALKDGDADVSGSPVAYTRLQILRSSIDTLEVEEVDLNVEEELKKYGISSPKTIDVCIASHFYELGLKAQKGEKV